jgi:hypothetical protein
VTADRRHSTDEVAVCAKEADARAKTDTIGAAEVGDEVIPTTLSALEGVTTGKAPSRRGLYMG